MSLRCAVIPPAPVPYREPLFEALHQRGLELLVIYQSAGQPSWDVPASWFPGAHPYPARYLSSWQRSRRGRTPITWPRGLERALARADPDCVVASEYGAASLRALRWCRFHGRAFVVLTECTRHMESTFSPVQQRVHRWVARRADGLIAVSSAGAERLRSLGVAAERITVALQSADVKSFRAAAAAPRSAAKRPVTVISVGRLVPDKNFTGLLDAFALSRLSPTEARLEIVGSGILAAELKQRAARLALPVAFRGHVPPQALPQLYADADIYATVSSYEPFGVAIREAAAAGLPMICTSAAGAVGDVAIDGRNAIVVDPDRLQDIASALRRLVEDHDLRRRLGQESQRIDAATDGREVDAFIAAVLAASRRRGRGGYGPSNAGSTSARMRSTPAAGR